MRSADPSISSCKRCQFYQSEGRRGGQCGQLNVPVQGAWKACCLAVLPFSLPRKQDWENLENLMALQTPLEQNVLLEAEKVVAEEPQVKLSA